MGHWGYSGILKTYLVECCDTTVLLFFNFSLNWGLSQYLPLDKAHSLILEVGAMGYSQWQVEKDSGSDVNKRFNSKDQIHAAGEQIGLLYTPWNAFIQFHGLQEFGAEARFEGQ
ncbi:MAG: hypothetical protein MRJ67_16740 [Nitrospirales bacterium]|nr:hypothetical protein [Nitrospira sp.]MDR4462139.1 hypothetical protein [Nitrospirales bacterium]